MCKCGILACKSAFAPNGHRVGTPTRFFCLINAYLVRLLFLRVNLFTLQWLNKSLVVLATFSEPSCLFFWCCFCFWFTILIRSLFLPRPITMPAAVSDIQPGYNDIYHNPTSFQNYIFFLLFISSINIRRFSHILGIHISLLQLP